MNGQKKSAVGEKQTASRLRLTGPKETAIQGDILDWLTIKEGVLAWRCNSGAVKTGRRFVRYGLGHGAADIIAVFRGRFVALEVKRPGEKPQPHQEAWGKELEAHGGVYRVVTCVSEARAVIEALRDCSVAA